MVNNKITENKKLDVLEKEEAIESGSGKLRTVAFQLSEEEHKKLKIAATIKGMHIKDFAKACVLPRINEIQFSVSPADQSAVDSDSSDDTTGDIDAPD